MPLQPPTRPHSANPRPNLPTLTPAIFGTNGSRGASTSSRAAPRGREEWEDAWDSSSDTEADDHADPRKSSLSLKDLPGTSFTDVESRGVPISVERSTSSEGVVAASWASNSYQHISNPPSSPPQTVPEERESPKRPQFASSKTYTEGVKPPAPGTNGVGTSGSGHGEVASGSKSALPPGGAWEMVEPSDIRDQGPVKPVVAGREAVRADVDDILNGGFQISFRIIGRD